MFERPKGGSRALLVSIEFSRGHVASPDADEFAELARSAGLHVIAEWRLKRNTAPDSKFFLGEGKVEEITAYVAEHQVELVLFNHELQGSQERNLEEKIACRVMDRTGLILTIFAERARSSEGQLQVELAQLEYTSTRLVRAWKHLERQKGGIGLRGGPGETQLEVDRRLITDRIKQTKQQLAKMKQQHQLSQRARKRAEWPTVSFVGYTNVGKSTLFNRLTQAKTYAADQLFATLDTTARRLELGDHSPIILTDTVGFIQQLPHTLIEAFHATLDQVANADLLLHVVDASDPERQERIEQVQAVLADIHADHVPQLLVYNKIDRLDMPAKIEYDAHGKIQKIWLSAHTGDGLAQLHRALMHYVNTDRIHNWIRIPAEQGQIRARFYEWGHVIQEEYCDDGGFLLEVEIQNRYFQELQHSDPRIQVDLTRPVSGVG
ncbi:ribosome rescue GTPase HflX [Thioflexithrix psekupsensis]|uniref:GTPase HflX n=1 Tax=Thioflexithrix psekupsensis TaxID=1570016 RepID=A0A251X8G6_9GAMM|nr:ribosome rescue GTPase HflX [Thioflexithrix psekupsensis]OUD14349.1 GTPase HflX [Thioflexithrix psekupsensis]